MAGVTRTAVDAALAARRGHTAVAVLLAQFDRLVRQIEHAHTAAERAEQARRARLAAEQMQAWLQRTPSPAARPEARLERTTRPMESRSAERQFPHGREFGRLVPGEAAQELGGGPDGVGVGAVRPESRLTRQRAGRKGADHRGDGRSGGTASARSFAARREAVARTAGYTDFAALIRATADERPQAVADRVGLARKSLLHPAAARCG